MSNVVTLPSWDAFAPVSTSMFDDLEWDKSPKYTSNLGPSYLPEAVSIGQHISMQEKFGDTADKMVSSMVQCTLTTKPEEVPQLIQKIDHYIGRLQMMRSQLMSLSNDSQSWPPAAPSEPVTVVTPTSSISHETSDCYSIQSIEETSTAPSKIIEAALKTTACPPQVKSYSPEERVSKKRKQPIEETSNDDSNSEVEDDSLAYILNRRAQNRVSARKCRERKKKEMTQLKSGLSDLRDENERLKRFVESKLGKEKTDVLLTKKMKEAQMNTTSALITSLKRDPFNRIMGPTELKFLQTLRDDALSIRNKLSNSKIQEERRRNSKKLTKCTKVRFHRTTSYM